jgi:hypothetical protein
VNKSLFALPAIREQYNELRARVAPPVKQAVARYQERAGELMSRNRGKVCYCAPVEAITPKSPQKPMARHET